MLDLTQPKNAHVDQRLRSEPIIWLSSTRPDGRPHLVPVWFLWDGSTILIFSQPKTQKVRNLRQQTAVMLALDSKEGGDVVLIEGQATLLDEPTAQVVPRAYFEKYAQDLKDMGTDPQQMAASYSQPIRITPTKFVSWSD
jgi:PPOX class probable F420-dependent enzyme